MVDTGPVDADDEGALRGWYDAFTAGTAAGRPDPPVESLGAAAVGLRERAGAAERVAFVAREADRVVGGALVELPLLENSTTAWVDIGVPPTSRRRGVGSALLAAVDALLAERGRTVVQAEVAVPAGADPDAWPGTGFARAHGFAVQHVEDRLVLDLPWSGALERSATGAGYRIRSWTGACPTELVDAYAAMRSAMARDVPTGQMTSEPAVWDADRLRGNEGRTLRRYEIVTSLAQTPDGGPAGYTLVYLDRWSGAHVLQDDTFVLAVHRGRGLGTALKVANLERLETVRRTRRLLHTWTARSNDAMRAVNARFGFRVVEASHEVERLAVAADVATADAARVSPATG